MKLRSVLFWLHLACGVVAGAVILIMSVTGALLTYQRQITAWADMRGYRSEPAQACGVCRPMRCVAKVAESRPDLSPTAIVGSIGSRRAGVARRRPRAAGVRQPVLGRGAGRRKRTGGARFFPRRGRVASIRCGAPARAVLPGVRSPARPTDVSLHRGERAVPLVAAHVDVGGGRNVTWFRGGLRRQGARLQLAQHDRLLVGDSAGGHRRRRRGHFVSVGDGPRLSRIW